MNPRYRSSTTDQDGRTVVSVDEGIAPLASASKPDLPLSRHPAPQSPDPLARTVPLLRNASATSVHGSDSRLIPPARMTPASSGLFTAPCYPLFLETVPTSAYPRHYPRLLLLGESFPRCHPVGTCSHEPTTRVTSFLTLVLRVRRTLLSAGFRGGEPGSRSNLPSPKPCPFWTQPILQRSLAFFDDGSTGGSLPAHRRLLPGITPLESGCT